MNIICKTFGHYIKPNRYGRYSGGTIDGMGTEHGFYKFECERCEEKVTLCIHFPSKEKDNKNGNK
jgi:hypothetical protein